MAAGIFQFTPLKHACLLRCRSPLSFLMSDWREGRWGTFVMGSKRPTELGQDQVYFYLGDGGSREKIRLIEGKPLYYFALSGKKTADVPPSFLDSILR